MASSNDYFVKFDSNAVAWAKQLESQLQPARKVINDMLSSLDKLDTKSSASGAKLQRALMANPQAQHVATGGQTRSAAGDAVNSALNRQADAIDDLSASLRVTVESMKQANAAIEAVPGKIQRTMASISTSLANMRAAHLEGKGRDQGAFVGGTSQQAVRNAVRNAVRGGDIDLSGRTGVRNVAAPSSITQIKRSDIDKANFDRIVNAIQAQTRALQAGGLRVAGPPGTAVSATGRPTRGSAVQSTEKAVDDAAARLNVIDEKIARVVSALGDKADAATNQLVRDLQEERAKLAAGARAAERDATGISQAEQKKRSAEQFAAQQQPPITDVERAENLRKQGLLAAPSAGDFMDRATGRPKRGDYTLKDLTEMADLYNDVGVAVKRTTRTTKDELAQLLRGASIQIREMFPGGVPPELATKGRAVQTTTKISPETAAMLGDLNDAVATRARAREIIAADRQSGGQRPPAAGPGMGGQVYGSSAVGSRGRREYGAAIFDPSAPTPLTRAGNQADLLKAYADIGPQIEAAIPRAVKLARDQAFNPYDAKHGVKIGRGSTEEENLGFAAAGRLRDIRKATAAVDDMGEEFELLTRALAKNERFVDRASDRLERGIKNPEGRDDREEIRLAQARIAEKKTRLAQLEAVGGDLFRDPAYQRGRRERTIAYGPETASGEKPLSPAEYYRRASTGEMRGARDISDARLMQQARAETFGGLKTAMGSRELMKMIPGLSINKNTGAWGATEGLSQNAQGALDKVVKKFDAADRQATRARAGGDPAKLAEAESKLEHAANNLANVVARSFNGISPTVRELTGRDAQDPAVQADEFTRVQARRDAEAERTRRFKDTPERSAEKLAQETIRNQKNLADAIARRAAINKQIADGEANIGKTLDPRLKSKKMADWAQADEDIQRLDAEKKRLEHSRRMTQDPANYDGSGIHDGTHLPGPKRRYDANLYDARLGYGPPIEDELSRVSKAQADAERRKRAAGQGLGGIGDLATSAKELDAVEREIGQLNAALAKNAAAAAKSAKAVDRNADATAKKAVGDANGALIAKRAQQEALKAQGAWTRRDIKAMSGDPAGQAAARARREQINALGREIGGLKGAGGAGAGGRGGRTAGGADFGDEGGILRQILAAIRDTNSILRKGVPTRGRVAGDAAAPTRSPARAAAAGSATPSDADLQAAMDEQRAVAERKRLAAEASAARKVEQTRRDQGAISRVSDADAAAMRNQARAAQDLASAMGQVSAATQGEITELRRLAAAAQNATTEQEQLAAAERLAAQQVKVVNRMRGDLGSAGVGSSGQRDATRSVLTSVTPSMKNDEFESIMRSSKASTGFRDVGTGWGNDLGHGAMDGFARTFGGSSSFWSRVMNTTGTFIVRNFAAGAVFGLTNVMQEILTQALAAEATFVRVSDALQATNKESGALRSNLANMSADYGVQLNDTYTTAASLTGLFSNVDDLSAATKISTQLQIISNGALNADEAVGVLASTMSSFGLEGVEGAERIADVFTSIQNNLGVNIEQTAEGVASMAGLAKTMNLSLEQSAVFVAAIAKQTNQTGAGAGEQFSRILASMQSGRSQNAIRDAFPELTESLQEGDYGAVLEGMMRGWDDLSSAQQENVAVTVAGQRQMRGFQGLMNGSTQALRALTKAQNSQGEAAQRVDQIMKNLQNRLRRLSTTFQALVDNLIQTGILNVIGALLIGITKVLGITNDLLSTFNQFADSNDFTRFLRDIAGFALGAVIALKLLKAASSGISGAIGARRRQREIEVAEHTARTGVGPAGVAGSRAAGAGGAPIPRTIAAATPFRGTGNVGQRGLLIGGMQNLLSPLTAATGNAGRRLGQWADSFKPQGRFSAPIHAFGQRLATEGANRMASLERTRAMVNQPGRPSLFGPTPLAVGGPQSFTRAQQISQKGMAGMSRSMTSFGRAAQVASVMGSRLAGAVGKLGLAGMGVDAAMLVIGAGLVRLSQNARTSARLTRVAEEAYENLYGNQRKKEEDAKVNPESDQYIGEAYAAWQQRLQEMQDADTGFNRVMGGLGLFVKNIGETLRLGTGGFTTVDEQLDQETGYIDGKPAGQNETLDLKNRVLQQIHGATIDPDDLEDIRTSSLAELKSMATEVKTSDLDGNQKVAWLAAIEEADAYIRDQIADRTATLENLAAGTQLNSEEINKLLGAVSTFSAVGTSGIVNAGGGNGAVDVSEFLRAQLDAIGLSEDSRLMARFSALLAPTDEELIAAIGTADVGRYIPTADSDMDLLKRTIGPGAVDVQRVGVAGNKEAYNQATRNRQDLIDTGIGEDDERVVQATADVQATFNAWMQSLDGLVTTIYAEADSWSTYQMNSGDTQGALQTQAQAIVDAEQVFRSANRDTIKLIRNAAEMPNRIRKRARELEKGIGRELNPSSGLDQAAQRFNIDDAYRTQLLNPVRELRRAFRGTAAWRANAARQIARVHALIQTAIVEATADFNLRIAAASTDKLKAELEAQRAAIIANMLSVFNSGKIPKDVKLTPAQRKAITNFGDAALPESEVGDAQAEALNSQTEAADAAKQDATDARQAQAELKQARLGVAAAWADARGDAVAGAKIQRQIAIVQLQAARAELAAATTATERASAMAGVYAAQAGVIAANAAIQQAQTDLLSSQYDVSIALAEAAGHTVQAARVRLQQARAMLGAAVKKSGGEATAEVNAARAAVIAAEADARDAKLQDQLDTIDFNLEMGKITQASAIKALQEILRTSDLTKEQRRQLLLQIKGMKDEMKDSQWNFGDIKLPTPYQMRRYIEQRKKDFRGQLDQAALSGQNGVQRVAGFDQGGAAAAASSNVNTTTINIGTNASLERVKKVVEDVVGRSARTTTSTPRRRI